MIHINLKLYLKPKDRASVLTYRAKNIQINECSCMRTVIVKKIRYKYEIVVCNEQKTNNDKTLR